ncbi:membrane-spanning 4-domains subfamily A member 15-like isoform X2 [Erythrolamprus reginae]|uniref:membrane-spanning 4-domains subfamily A member 15-like isoform X2 n=1 Tax=Erythrolamprus reginae TaxID=121349 RepID=UPI00396CDE97
MASATIFVHPSNGGNIIQTAPGFPSVPLQAPGAIPYPQYGAQQLGIPTNAPQQVPQNSPLERFFNAEPKVLGAIQIMIGLLHIGFGAVSLILFPSYYVSLSGIGAYPFWGGIFFIATGSVCVSAVNHPNRALGIGYGISSLLLLFSLLEFCIAVSLAHFGCQATCHSGAQPTLVFVPYPVIGGRDVAAQPNPPPLSYDNMVTKSQ